MLQPRRAGCSTNAIGAAGATLLLAGAIALGGCQDGPAMTAEDAYLHLAKACAKGDPARLFDALDTDTQWSIETVQHNQREMRRLVLESYPPEERDRALARIPEAVEEDEEHPRRYFRRLPDSPAKLAEVGRRMQLGEGRPVGSVDQKTWTATVWRTGGSILHFARDAKGRWGFSELRPDWEHAKLRATHDLETVRQNAALYRGAPAGAK